MNATEIYENNTDNLSPWPPLPARPDNVIDDSSSLPSSMDEYYEYSMDYMSSSSWSASSIERSTELKINVPIFSVCFVVGCVGNLLVIYAVIKSKRLHNAPCLLLANLAVADLLTILVEVPLMLALYLLAGEWSHGAALCRLQPYIFITPPVCAVFTMIAISIERYYVVLHPLRARPFVTMGRVKKVIIGVWVTSCVLTIPALFNKKLYTAYLPDERLVFCVNAWPNRGLIIAYNAYICSLVFFVPLIIVSYIYIRIGFHLHRTRKGVGNSKDLPAAYRDSSGWSSGSNMTTHTQNVTSGEETEMGTVRPLPSRAENDSSVPRRHRTSDEGDNIQRVIRMLVVVVAVFILTWGPITTFVLINQFVPLVNKYSHILTPLLHLLACCSSCMNPIIYAFMSKAFRQSFKEVIKECCCSSPLCHSAG